MSEILLNRLLRSKSAQTRELDKNSVNLLWLVIATSITAAVIISIYFSFPIAGSIWISYAGILLILCGILIRFIAIKTLGTFFTVNLSVEGDQKIIKSGMYKYIRHPSYTGSLLSFLGLGVSLNNWISLAVIFVPVLIAFIYRMGIEEKMLIKHSGPEYEAYMKETKRLIPKIY